MPLVAPPSLTRLFKEEVPQVVDVDLGPGAGGLPHRRLHGGQGQDLHESPQAVAVLLLQAPAVHQVAWPGLGSKLLLARYGKTPNPEQMKATGGFCPICQDAYQVRCHGVIL